VNILLSCNLSIALSNCKLFCSIEATTTLTHRVFNNCKIMGVDFTKCDTLMIDFSMDECKIKNCLFSNLNLKKCNFYKSEVMESDFVNTNLSGSNLSESNFSGSLFHNTNLFKVNLIKSINYNINPLKNNIKEADFSLPEAMTLLNAFQITIQ